MHIAFSKFYFIYTSAPFSFKCVASWYSARRESEVVMYTAIFFCNLSKAACLWHSLDACSRESKLRYTFSGLCIYARQLFNENACASAINCGNCHSQYYAERSAAGKISCSPVQPDAHQETCTYLYICNCNKYACLSHAAPAAFYLALW